MRLLCSVLSENILVAYLATLILTVRTTCPSNTICGPYGVLILDQRRSRWPSIKAAPGRRLVLSG